MHPPIQVNMKSMLAQRNLSPRVTYYMILFLWRYPTYKSVTMRNKPWLKGAKGETLKSTGQYFGETGPYSDLAGYCMKLKCVQFVN